MEKHEEYIKLLQPIMEAKEAEIKNKRINLDLNDTDEAPSEEDISSTELINAMEADMEVSPEE